MSDTSVTGLLAAALQGAADVVRQRLEREVAVTPSEGLKSSAILRFDLTFTRGGRLSWFVSNEDATGFADMLIGGEGDRAAALTEMHLDALTVAFGDMLSRAVDGIAAGLAEPLEAGGLDLGMENELPAVEPGGHQTVHALEITGFGQFPVVQQADAALSTFLAQHVVLATGDATAALPGRIDAAEAALTDTPPVSAGPSGDARHAPAAAAAPAGAPLDNVVRMPAAAAASPTTPRRGDLELLMNVPLPLTVELGRTQRTVRELVDFTVGSIIELGKLAGDPLDIMVNERVIARGEVVVIDEEFGIRVTEIVSPEDRLRGIG